jgi:hypothetical protein
MQPDSPRVRRTQGQVPIVRKERGQVRTELANSVHARLVVHGSSHFGTHSRFLVIHPLSVCPPLLHYARCCHDLMAAVVTWSACRPDKLPAPIAAQMPTAMAALMRRRRQHCEETTSKHRNSTCVPYSALLEAHLPAPAWAMCRNLLFRMQMLMDGVSSQVERDDLIR